MGKKLLLIGGGGHCKSVLEAALTMNVFTEIGIIDQKEKYGSFVLGKKVVGCDDDLGELIDGGFGYAFVSLGSNGLPKRRIELYNIVKQLGYIVPVIKHASANVAESSSVKEGVFIGKNVTLNGDTKILKNAILNTGCIIEHDCQIGTFSHIAPGSILSGTVEIGDNTHIGAGSVLKQNIKIGNNVVVGIGSVVTKDIESNSLAYGNPCRVVEKLIEK